MAFLPIALQPGIFRNGTEYQAGKLNRYWSANLVRWFGVVLAPIGGWTKRSSTNTFSGMARAVITWRALTGARWIGIGTHTGLYVSDPGGGITNVTPVGFTAGSADQSANLGFGVGGFGTGAFGTPRADTGSITEASVWSLDKFGQYLVACGAWDGKCYSWTLNIASVAAAITNAPTGCTGVVVANAFLFALGAGSDARKVQWSGQADYTVWTPSSTNLAGSVELDTDGQIKRGLKVGPEVLILTDTDAHGGSYVGLPSVWSFNRVGDGCGVIGPGAAVATGALAVWWSFAGFMTYQGGVVQPIPCDVWSYLLQNVNMGQRTKIVAWHNVKHGEVWWQYASVGSTEIDSAVVWNYRDNWWNIHALARTCGTPAGVFANPILCDTSGYVYEHETGTNYSGAVPYAESAPIEFGGGDRVMNCSAVIADEETVGDVTVQFKTRLYPNGPETTLSPITLSATGRTDARFSARQAKMRITAAATDDWRFGMARLELQTGGMR